MNILITGAWQQAKEYFGIIQEKGHNVHFLQYEKENLPCSYEWVEGIIGNGIFLSHPIEKFTNLKYIQLTSAGFDRVPMKYVKKHGIIVNNARGVYSIPMAEYALTGVLSLYKQFNTFASKQTSHSWEKIRDLQELYNKNVCILGCGSVGTECAKRFSAFGCNVSGIDLFDIVSPLFSQVFHLDDISTVLPQADIVVITLPLTDMTHHMFDSNLFSIMKSGSVIVNIARGAIIETDSMVEALNTKLGGAILDVFEEEPLSDSPLWDMKNVIITPHNSFVGNGNNERMSDVIMKNLEKY